MKYSEAMKCLEDGKKVRRTTWKKGEFIYLDGSIIKNQDGNIFKTIAFSGDWEEYDSRKIKPLEPPKLNVYTNGKVTQVSGIPDLVDIYRKLNEVIDYINRGER